MSILTTPEAVARRAQTIRSAREGTGLTREQLATAADVSVSTIVRLENLGQLPNAEALARITARIGVSLDALLNGADA